MKCIFLLSTLFLFGTYFSNLQAQTIYVDSSNTEGAHDGLKWETAFADFQAAIDHADDGDTIFVAKGTYQPEGGVSFSMKEGVKIYGGFAGTETSLAHRSLSDNKESILKGNKNRVINNSKNNLTANAVLDGFTITEGNSCDDGAGMYNINSSPTLVNLIFCYNRSNVGAGMYNKHSSPQLMNITFKNNTAHLGGGGGMYNYYFSIPTLSNITFTHNTAVYGGGMFNEEYSSPSLTNVIFKNNKASLGGGIYNTNSSPTLEFCVFKDNKSTSGGESIHNDPIGPPINNK